MLPGKIAFLLIVATVLSVIGALVVANRYRAAMQRLMKIGQETASTATAAIPAPGLPAAADLPPVTVSLDDNRRAERQLIAAFVALTLVMALTRTLQMQIMADGPITWKTVLTLGAAYAWPVVPVIAVIDRWRRRRLVGTLLLWFAAAVALLTWRVNENVSFAQVLFWMSLDIGLPLVIVTALCLGGATRAVGPWLAPVFIILCWASQAGVDLLSELVDRGSPVVYWLIGRRLPVTGAIALFALAPWLIAWWPARALGRWLAAAYARRQISELFYLFTAVWAIALTGPALGAIPENGWGALLVFLPLLWIPLAAQVMRKTSGRRPPGRPPTLLVLRVFRQDANVQDLFDRVIERWRLTGNTVLIAGTDLVERTIDADDIFTFLDGRLGERFIHNAGEVPRRLAEFQWQADVEGRYRVNECYCHDTTWQQALAALVRASDAVLMDLRNFVAHNEGCLHELRVLATTPGLARVVVLMNEKTQLPAAQAAIAEAIASAPAGRFVWLTQHGEAPPATEEVLAPLFFAPAKA